MERIKRKLRSKFWGVSHEWNSALGGQAQLVLGIFCFCAGVLVFFLFCTLIVYSAEGPARAFPFDNAIPWLIGANAILAIFTSLALNRMSVPRYQ